MIELLPGPFSEVYSKHPWLSSLGFLIVWLLLGALVWYVLAIYPARKSGEGVAGPINKGPGSNTIRQIIVEARLTCTAKAGVELPPSEVPFLPIGDACAYLTGPAGRFRLAFESPVRFRHLKDGSIVVMNRFALETGSDLLNRPMGVLSDFEVLQVPIVTVVYGGSLARMRLLEVTMIVNGEDTWYGSYRHGDPFKQGPVFQVPLASMKATGA